MTQYYLLLKFLHILGTILFLGNIIVTAFWKAFADRSKNWQIISFSQRLVTYTDIFFTFIGIAMIVTTGLLMARYFQNYWDLKWLVWGVTLFIISFLIWIIILIPVQIKLHGIASKFKDTEIIPFQYWSFEKVWMVFGVIATVLPFLSLYFMVFKP